MIRIMVCERSRINMITSTQNNKVKEWKKLHAKKGRTKANAFLIEGFHLIEEAYRTDQQIEELIVQEGIENPGWLQDEYVHTVSEQVFKEISQTEAPQGIAAVVKMQTQQGPFDGPVLLIDAVQDPGNLGTMIRTADAAGFSKVVLGKGTVDLYNDKVIRSTQGSLFHISVEQADLLAVIPDLQEAGFTVWGSTLRRAQNYANVKPHPKTAVIVGNEGAGVADEIIELADELVKIPIYGKAESLNVAIAAAILMYHVRS